MITTIAIDDYELKYHIETSVDSLSVVLNPSRTFFSTCHVGPGLEPFACQKDYMGVVLRMRR